LHFDALPQSSLCLKVSLDRRADAKYIHPVRNVRPACHNRLLLLPIPDPNLAVETFAIPAEFRIRDGFHIQILKSAKDGIILRNRAMLSANADGDKPVEGLKDIGMFHNSNEWRLAENGLEDHVNSDKIS
jgi:hypothetical protein